MAVIQMSDRELTRLRVMIDVADGRLTVEAAATLVGLGRRQMFRLRRAFDAGGPSALASRKCGHPSNRRHGEAFRRTILALVRERYPDFGPTLATEKLAERHGLTIGVETLLQWMIVEGLWIDRRHRLPSPHQPRQRRGGVANHRRSRPRDARWRRTTTRLRSRLIGASRAHGIGDDAGRGRRPQGLRCAHRLRRLRPLPPPSARPTCRVAKSVSAAFGVSSLLCTSDISIGEKM